MENWGLILYRETKVHQRFSSFMSFVHNMVLHFKVVGHPVKVCIVTIVQVLYSDKKTNSRAKQRIAYMVAHELAHQVGFTLLIQLSTVNCPIVHWTLSSVVWQLGDNELVERPVAQRRLRHLARI